MSLLNTVELVSILFLSVFAKKYRSAITQRPCQQTPLGWVVAMSLGFSESF